MTAKSKRDVSFRFTPEEMQRFRDIATERGLSLSRTIREVVERAVTEPGFYVMIPSTLRQSLIQTANRRGITIEQVLLEQLDREQP